MSPPPAATIPLRRLMLILGLMTALPWVFTRLGAAGGDFKRTGLFGTRVHWPPC